MLLRYLLHLSLWSYLAYATASSKRGLIYISDTDDVTEDVHYYTSSSSDLTWYYNYGASPSSDLENSTLQFVPMLWGADDGYDTFLSTIQNLIGNGTNITHVLGFNEPDGDRDTGGSSIDADTAAEAWISQIQPLRKQGVKLGLPAVTGSASGLAWLKKFNESCDGDCTADFIPIHWYGNFEGLASYIGQIRAAYPNLTIWVTEFAYSSEDLSTSQSFYNQSTQYFDRLEYITHYSYFGSFRSDDSNVGANVAMLTSSGKLTDIGSWYLGGNATGNTPSSAARAIAFSRSAVVSWAAAAAVMVVLMMGL